MTVAGDVVSTASADAPGTAPAVRQNKPIDTGQGRLAFYLIAPTIVFLAVVVGYPIVKGIYSSFLTDRGLDASGFYNDGGAWNGFTNYAHWLGNRCGDVSCPDGNLGSQFWPSILTTLLFTVATVVLETVIGFSFALVMNRNFKGRAIVRAAILVPWAIPTAVTSKLWGVVFDPNGVLNRVLGTHFLWTSQVAPARFAIIIADTWKTAPFIALLILAGLQGISAETYEAATVDGATPWQRFWKITFPLVRPALAVAVIFRTLDALRMYDLPAILTGGANGTTTISILVVDQIKSGLNSASALSTIAFIFIFGIALGLVRLFNANITGSAPKVRKRELKKA